MKRANNFFFSYCVSLAFFATPSLADNQCALDAFDRYQRELDSCGSVPDESWTCRTEVTDRDGEVGQGNCSSTGPNNYACYVERTETCTESVSGRTRSHNWREYTGECVPSFSDCW